MEDNDPSSTPFALETLQLSRPAGSRDPVSLAEVKFYHHGRPVNPHALGATATATPADPSHPATNLFDENPNTFTQTAATTDRASITIQFPSPTGVTHVVLRNRRDCCPEKMLGCLLTIRNPMTSSTYMMDSTQTDYVFCVGPNGFRRC